MNLLSNYKRAVTETIEMLLYYMLIETLYYRNYTLDTSYYRESSAFCAFSHFQISHKCLKTHHLH